MDNACCSLGQRVYIKNIFHKKKDVSYDTSFFIQPVNIIG